LWKKKIRQNTCNWWEVKLVFIYTFKCVIGSKTRLGQNSKKGPAKIQRESEDSQKPLNTPSPFFYTADKKVHEISDASLPPTWLPIGSWKD
jgi:hypothetical protein